MSILTIADGYSGNRQLLKKKVNSYKVPYIEQQKKMVILLLLMSIVHTYDFSTAIITVTVGSSGTLKNAPGSDICKKLIVRPTQIFHLSSTGLYESWNPSALSTSVDDKTVNSVYTVFDMGVGPTGKNVVFSHGGLLTTTIKYYGLTTSYTVSSSLSDQFSSLLSTAADYVFIDSNYIYTYYISGYSLGKSTLIKISKSTHNTISYVNIDSAPPNIAFTPDYKKAILWSNSLIISIFNLPSLQYVGYIEPGAPVPNAITQKITFSADSTLAVIETDSFYPIVILNLTSYESWGTVFINDVINEVHFLDNKNEVLVVVAQNSLTFVDLITGLQYALPKLTATVLDTDHIGGNIYTCKSNTVSQTYYNFTRITPAPIITNSSGASNSSDLLNLTDTTNSSYIFNDTDDTTFEPIYPRADAGFFVHYKIPASQVVIYQVINNTLDMTHQATSLMTTITSSFPLSVYFLGFLNYFTLSSLYVLLNFPIPEELYNYLSTIYSEISQDLLTFLQMESSLPPFSQETVDSPRALFFSVSSDVISSNVNNFTIFVANVLLVVIMQVLFSRLAKKNIFRTLIQKEKYTMIYGQITNLIIPLTLPWSFIMIKGGVIDFKSKLNWVIFSAFFFMSVFVPIYYLFELVANQRRRKKSKSDKNKKNHQNHVQTNIVRKTVSNFQAGEKRKRRKPLNNVKKAKFADNFEVLSSAPGSTILPSLDKTKVKQTYKILKIQIQQETTIQVVKQKPLHFFGDLLTWEVAEAWYLCEANFLLPALVLFNSPVFFFVTVLLFLFLGLLIATRRRKWRINAIFLAIYPLVFHCCFCVFYWSTSDQLLVISQLVCLSVFIIGAAHHCVLLIVQVLVFIYSMIRKLCKNNNKVTPSKKSTIKTIRAVTQQKGTSKSISSKKQAKQTNIYNPTIVFENIHGLDPKEEQKSIRLKDYLADLNKTRCFKSQLSKNKSRYQRSQQHKKMRANQDAESYDIVMQTSKSKKQSKVKKTMTYGTNSHLRVQDSKKTVDY